MKHLTPTLSAFATGRAVAPLWIAPNGRAFYPIAGGSQDPDPTPDPDPKPDPKQDDPPKFEPITSQADLDRIVGNRVARERAKFADYDELKDKASKYDQGIEDAKDEHQKAVDAARKEGETAALERANVRLVDAEARALAAAAKFRNPALAVKAIDLSGVKVAEDGTVDAEAIKAKLDDLSTAEPYLVDDGKKPTPRPDPSQGGGGGGDDAPSVSRGRDMFAERHKKTS